MASKKDANGRPQISNVTPEAAIPGGELQIRGAGLARAARPHVRIGDVDAPIVIGSDSYVIVKVPEGASAGELIVEAGKQSSRVWNCGIGIQVAENLYPVGNPAVDRLGNIYVTFSGSRGQKTPVSVYKIDLNYNAKPFVSDVMNATGLAFDRGGTLYISSRHDGIVYQVTPSGNASVYVEGMGIATGLAFDSEENLYVGDRSGTIFKISPSREIFVFATLEPSISAYHLAFHPAGDLYVTGPTTSSYDRVFRITRGGEVIVFYRGLGRPQGMAFDRDANLYVAASLGGRRGIVRISPQGHAEIVLSGSGLVGLALQPSGRAILATSTYDGRAMPEGAVFALDWDVHGLPLFG